MSQRLLDTAIDVLETDIENAPITLRQSMSQTLARLKAVKANICASPDLCGTICDICRNDPGIMAQHLWRD